MSMALVMSFIELWRALDSHFYRTSPHRAGNAELTRGVIPLMVTRHQRYFFNRLRLKNGHKACAMSGTTGTTYQIRLSRTRHTATWTCSISTSCGAVLIDSTRKWHLWASPFRCTMRMLRALCQHLPAYCAAGGNRRRRQRARQRSTGTRPSPTRKVRQTATTMC